MFGAFPGWLAIAVRASMLMISVTFAHADSVPMVTGLSGEATIQGKNATILTSLAMK